MKKIRVVGKIINWVLVIVLLLTGSAMVLLAFSIPGELKLYMVQSGSMEPAIRVGSIVVTKSFEKYTPGDIITYKSEKDRDNTKPEITTTHRIIRKEEQEKNVKYITKGDANNTEDNTSVDIDLILGKVIFSIPLLGYIVSFSKTPLGLITLIIIPTTIIVYNEILNIKKEVERIIREKKKKREAVYVQKGIFELFDKLSKQSEKKV